MNSPAASSTKKPPTAAIATACAVPRSRKASRRSRKSARRSFDAERAKQIVLPCHGRACPGHPRLLCCQVCKDVDARDKPGHDELRYEVPPTIGCIGLASLLVNKRDGIRNAGTRGAIAVDLVGVI